MITCATVDLPDPVPPTRPSVRPRAILKLTPSTATISARFWRKPVPVSNVTRKIRHLDEVRVERRPARGALAGRGFQFGHHSLIHPSDSVPKQRALRLSSRAVSPGTSALQASRTYLQRPANLQPGITSDGSGA